MTTTFKQDGKVIQYTAGADISAGAVVKIGNIHPIKKLASCFSVSPKP